MQVTLNQILTILSCFRQGKERGDEESMQYLFIEEHRMDLGCRRTISDIRHR